MATQSQKGLGRGFDTLLPSNFDDSILVDKNDRIQKLAPQQIKPNKHQPRASFNEQALAELADSIKRFGILQPLVVTPAEAADQYYLIAGERRWRAAQKAGLKNIPVIVRTSEELEQLEIALVENVQRVDLSALEQAKSIQRLHDQFNIDYEVIAKRLGKHPTTIINIVRLLGLPSEAQAALNDKKITEGHARAILALKEDEHKAQLLGLIIEKGWSVRQAEQYVIAHKQGAKTSQKAEQRIAIATPQTEKLSKIIKAPVTLKRLAKGGRLEIGFKNDRDLKRIIELLNKTDSI